MSDQPVVIITGAGAGSGYRFQAEEAARCIAAARRESTVMPLMETLRIMETLDDVRAQLGVTYPGE